MRNHGFPHGNIQYFRLPRVSFLLSTSGKNEACELHIGELEGLFDEDRSPGL